MYEPLAHWRRHTHLLREGLLKRVDELSISDYPEATPYEVILYLQEFLSHLTEVIDKSTSEDRLRSLSSLIRELGVFLEWLDNANTEQTPRGLVQLLKDIIDQMVPNSRVLARPQALYNYSIADLGELLSNLVKNYIPLSKQTAFDTYLKSPIKLISFPRIERDNVLAYAIFGHELGHPVAANFLNQENTDAAHKATYLEIQKQVSALVDQESAGKSLDDSIKLTYATRAFDDILQIRKRALEELISDAVGVFIFGPSALFAFYELLWDGNWDTKPASEEWYPPSRMRLRLMLKIVDESGFMDKLPTIFPEKSTSPYVVAIQEFIGEAKKLASTETDKAKISADRKLTIAYAWMESSLAQAIAYAKEKTKNVALQTDAVMPQLSELIQRLELGVPPNEVGNPMEPKIVDYRASMIAAWMFKLRGIDPKTGKSLSSKEIERLHQKTLSAIEYVILQTTYATDVKENL